MNLMSWQDKLFDTTPTLAVLAVFLLIVIAVTFVQAVRVAWSAFRAAPSALSSLATRVAHSTRGLARAAVWLTCAATAVGLQSAMILYGNTSEPPMKTLLRQHLDVLEAIAICLGLCALLFAASLVFDLVAAGSSRRTNVVLCGHVVIGVIALVLVNWVLLGLRPTAVPASGRDPQFTQAIFDVIDQLWTRLAIILAAAGVLTWLTTLLESAMLRRLDSRRELG